MPPKKDLKPLLSKQERMVEKQKRKEEKKVKQALKTERKQLKQERKDLEMDDEEDINVTIKKITNQTKMSTNTGQLVLSDQPSPRVHFTLTPTPANDLILFGGQYFDGQSQFIYGDLYRWK